MELTVAQIEMLYHKTKGFRAEAVVPITDYGLRPGLGIIEYKIYHVTGTIFPDGHGTSYKKDGSVLSNYTLHGERSAPA